jgi:tetratricopeptide (TPR) repeat protein
MEPRLAPVAALAIEHVDALSPPAFKLTRLSDGKSVVPVAIPSPYEAEVEGRPNSHLMRELRWYLECFLDYPFHPETVHADHVLAALKAWGAQAFNALFNRRDAGEWLAGSSILQIRSDDPHILSWPWEALFDSQAGSYLAHQRRIERRLNNLPDPQSVAGLPSDRINILLVVARPYEADVRYRSIARPLVELIRSENLPAHVDVLRPPTFDQLRNHLRQHAGYYHVLHFDGHGAYGDGGDQYSPHQFRARQGCLVFESKKGEPDPKSAGDLSVLLREHAVPAVVLNACQSAALDEKAEDAFATVATALLQSGMRSVVAMAYSLYVSGAQVFLPAFYGRLFETGTIAEAVRAGRQQMLADKNRVSARGPYPLEDWLLPVLYQQAPLDFDFAPQARRETRESHLPKEVLEHRDYYGFIGRDGPILEMERALHRNTPCILIQGLGGVGKTTLARGFLNWLDETGGLDGALWFDFREIRTAEYVLNRTGEVFYGENFGIAPNKLELLTGALKEHRVIVVWDNFESAAQNLTGEDRALLGRFLDAIRGSRGKVIITSRSGEEWLGPSRRFNLGLHGLDGEERWEYCEVILRELGLKVNRSDPELSNLMNQLGGHPLAMRVILLKLEQMSAAKISEALRNNIAELGLDEQEEQGRLFATLRFVEQGLDEDLQPLMNLIGLHEAYFDADYLEAMAEQVDPEWTRQRIDRLAAALEAAGLVRDIGEATYEMHPLLTSYLRSRAEAESCQRAFVDVMARLADRLAPRPHHEQRVPFLLHGPNLHYALSLAKELAMDQHLSALTRSLASFAQKSRNFVEASRLFGQLAQQSVAGTDLDGEASAYHQLGMIAQQQREFETAREWYLKSLAIKEQQGNLHGAAITYHQLGRIAEEQREFETAREWYLKSLAIEEKQGNLHGAANTYGQLGILAGQQGSVENSGKWLVRSIAGFLQVEDQYMAERGVENFLVLHQRASAEDKRKLEAIWRDSGLGLFPGEPKQ